MTRFGLPLFAVLFGSFVACTPLPETGSATPGAGGDSMLVGTVRVVGSLPVSTQVVLQQDEGRTVTLSGPLLAEMENLSGVRVAVRGVLEKGVLRADGYEIRSVDGAPVEAGVVEQAPGGGMQLRKADGSVLMLAGGASRLRPGQKVWVQGPQSLQVQTYGVIAP